MKPLAKSLLTVGLSAALVTPAFAASPFEDSAPRRTAAVSVADLDLGTTAGQRALDTRIEIAIRQVCRSVSVETGTRIMDQTAQECKARARAEAKQQVAALLRSDTQRGG
ncbi:MAG: UrcA family protein [Erythrobacter sp.]